MEMSNRFRPIEQFGMLSGTSAPDAKVVAASTLVLGCVRALAGPLKQFHSLLARLSRSFLGYDAGVGQTVR
jgi:hypothetical protein